MAGVDIIETEGRPADCSEEPDGEIGLPMPLP